MGNRAVITTPERKVGVYLHWNGGRDTIEPLLKYCELQGYRPPSSDEYGFARICQVMGNFFGGSLSLGVGAYTTDRQMDPGDNGIYVIEGWRIADHLRTEYDSDWNPVGMRSFGPSEEEDWHKFDDMLRAFDASMPEELRLGELLDSVEVPASELQVGDKAWMYDSVRGKWETFVSATAKSAERATLSRRRRPRFPAGGATALWPPALPRAAAQGALDRGVVEVRGPDLNLQRRGALGVPGRDRPARDLPSAELREPDRHRDVLCAERGQPPRGVRGPHDCPLSGSPSPSAASASRSFMR